MLSLRAKRFSCSLDVLYGGLGISKLQFLIKEEIKKFQAVIFQVLVIKTLDPKPDPYPDPDPDSLKTLDPYPDLDSLKMLDLDPDSKKQ
jgi:hypothetical protein